MIINAWETVSKEKIKIDSSIDLKIDQIKNMIAQSFKRFMAYVSTILY